MNQSRTYSFIDRIIMQLQSAAETIGGHYNSHRQSPAHAVKESVLSSHEKKKSIGYMRVNHTGEVCAQALYRGQLITARDSAVKSTLETAAAEETDHLAWCHERLDQLQGRRSLLNPFWYSQSFLIGISAGLLGDAWSLGFLEETEKQVENHLARHLEPEQLPLSDNKSRAIVSQMQIDEAHHGQSAHEIGAEALPDPVKKLMKWQSRMMTTLAYWI
jgi:ubiquinone biosynthesis monooxygenase Coq7